MILRSIKNRKPKSRSQQNVQAPAAQGRIQRTTFLSAETTIKHREMVATLTNSSNVIFFVEAFSKASPGFDINPGNPYLFPWLSGVATRYEKYKFNNIKFDLVTCMPTSTPGRYYAAIDYDWDDEIPQSKQQMMSYLGAAESPIWQNMSIAASSVALKSNGPKYIAKTTYRADPEPRTSNTGFLIVAFDTTTVDCSIELWVDYEVQLQVPQLDNEYMVNIPDTPQAKTNVTTAGTSNYGLHPVPGNISNVLPWVNFTAIDNNLPVNGGYDVKDLNDANLTMIGVVSETGQTPAFEATTRGAGFFVKMFDALHKFIAIIDSSNPNLPSVTTQKGNVDFTTWSSAGAIIRFLQSFPIREIKNVYKSVRYLVPYITSSQAIGAGTVGIDVKVEL